MRFVLRPIYNEMGFDEKPSETHVELMHRALIIQQSCFYGLEWCVNVAQLKYHDWMGNKTRNM